MWRSADACISLLSLPNVTGICTFVDTEVHYNDSSYLKVQKSMVQNQKPLQQLRVTLASNSCTNRRHDKSYLEAWETNINGIQSKSSINGIQSKSSKSLTEGKATEVWSPLKIWIADPFMLEFHTSFLCLLKKRFTFLWGGSSNCKQNIVFLYSFSSWPRVLLADALFMPYIWQVCDYSQNFDQLSACSLTTQTRVIRYPPIIYHTPKYLCCFIYFSSFMKTIE